MPTYRNISIAIISQYDCLQLPEYAPRANLADPFTTQPTLISPSEGLVSVYIPTYPASTFWLSYSISAPHPPKAEYYFKLFLNGNHFVSWGCGEKERFMGKTMFGLFRGPGGEMERRVLSFQPEEDDGSGMVRNDVMEVRVYRAKGRRKAIAEVEPFDTGDSRVSNSLGIKDSGIKLLNAGFLHGRHPTNYYQYALLDPLDQPFASFRYYYRSWEDLERLSKTSPSHSPTRTSPSLPILPSPTTPTRHSLVSLYTPAQRLLESFSTIPSPPSPTGDSPLRLPPISLPRPPSPPRFQPDSPKKQQPEAYSPRIATAPARPRFGNRLFFRASPRKNNTVQPCTPTPPKDAIRPATPLTTEPSRRTDFGGIVAQLMRRSPSPDRGRQKNETRGRSAGRGSPTPSRRREGSSALDTVEEEDEEDRGEDSEGQKLRKTKSVGVLRGALDSAIKRKEKGRVSEEGAR